MFLDRTHDEGMVQIVEETLNIEVDAPVIPPAPLPCCRDCIQRRLSGSVAIGVRMEVWFHLRLQIQLDDHLGHSVRHGGNTELSLASISLRYRNSANWRRKVGP